MNTKSKPVKIDVNIDGAVTTISCGHILVELIKFLIYQRHQIPYSYPWLKQIVSKRKLCEDTPKSLSLQSETHFYTVSTSLDNLDSMLKSLMQEINGCSMPQEVCIGFGGTPVALKEVYRIILPTVCHKPQCNTTLLACDQKIQRNVFKTLVTSELSEVFTNPLKPTSLYIWVKKMQVYMDKNVTLGDNFFYTNGYCIPKTSKVVVINFNTVDKTATCCNEIKVFGDMETKLESLKIDDRNKDINYFEVESSENESWFQSIYVMKGFKDCFIKGSSVMNQWTD